MMQNQHLNYRHRARESLRRAKIEMASNQPERLRYAALELREVIEALTYDRAFAFKAEIPPEEYKTWQPRKLMSVLLDIDPKIGITSTLSYGRERKLGEPPPGAEMKYLGKDEVFTLSDIKKTYDAIGSYLHMPSLEQILSTNTPDLDSLRSRCDFIVVVAERVLSSTIWNSTLGVFSALPHCMNEACGKPIRKRIPRGATRIEAECHNCKASYTIEGDLDGQCKWVPNVQNVSCANSECSGVTQLWNHEICPGTHWKCKDCGKKSILAIGVVGMDEFVKLD